MRLVRNTSPDLKGKYALLNLGKNTIEYGLPNTKEEFFVIKLKEMPDGILDIDKGEFSDFIELNS